MSQFTDKPECPHCGAIEEDPDFWPGDSDIEISCGFCGGEYVAERHVLVSYSTTKAVKRTQLLLAYQTTSKEGSV